MDKIVLEGFIGFLNSTGIAVFIQNAKNAMGPNVAGVIGSAVAAGVFLSMFS